MHQRLIALNDYEQKTMIPLVGRHSQEVNKLDFLPAMVCFMCFTLCLKVDQR